MFDIVGIGISVFDKVLTVADYPREDTKVYSSMSDFQCGGPAATGVVAASILGSKTAFLGVFTDDEHSLAMLDDFERYNVDTSNIVIKKGYTSTSAVVINSSSSGTRTIIVEKGTVPPAQAEDIPNNLIKGARILYLDGNQLDAAEYACRIAKNNGVKVLLDAGNPYPGIEKILQHTDILIASEEFTRRFRGDNDFKKCSMSIISEFSPEVFIVTCGDKGGYCFDGNKLVRYQSFTPPGKIINTNGAGDVFHGAFAHFYVKGLPLLQCINYASAAAAIKCTRKKVRAGVPEKKEILDFTKSYNKYGEK
jgi:sugar/nucleoside kinase (ribokinase family)